MGRDSSGSNPGNKESKVPVEPEKDRIEEMPSILLTWEPLEKCGRAVVQFYMPTFFVAGLELDLGSTIMIQNNSEFGWDELKTKKKYGSRTIQRSRQASMGTIRMIKATKSSVGRK